MKFIIPLLLLVTPVYAQTAPGHTHEGALGPFYNSWMMPDNRKVSCCHEQDCAPAQSKMVNGAWWARHTDDEDWTRIPENKIEADRDSPDGRSHLCGRKYTFMGMGTGFTVFCFLPAGGS